MKLAVRVIPNAVHTVLAGERDGEIVLRVNAPALDGRANQAAIRCLAQALEVPRARVRLIAGEKSRHKKFEIVGLEPGSARQKLADLQARISHRQ